MLSGLPFYVWEVPDKPISIHLRYDVIDRIVPEIMRGFGALKRRGAEVGGLLLGRSDAGFDQKVMIEDFEPIPTEYLTGPSYNLSENDLVTFEAAIARRQSVPNGRLSVVGFYRSHTRDDLFMDDADLALASRYFPGSENVFLIVKPFATRTSIGGFFFWENDEIYRESTYLQFPFNRVELGGGEARHMPAPGPQIEPAPVEMDRPETDRPLPPYNPSYELVRSAPRPAEPEPEPEPEVEIPWPNVRSSNLSILSAPPSLSAAPERPPRRLPGWRWLLVPSFVALAGAAGFFGYQNLNNPRQQQIAPAAVESALPLKLSVTERKDQLDVTWDRNAAPIAHANRGVLSISDGSNRRDLELTGAQLRNGRVLYSRLSGDVGIRLEVFQEGSESITESIRIVSAEPANRATVPERRTSQQNAIADRPSAPQPDVRPSPPLTKSTSRTPPPVRRAAAKTEAPPKPPEPQPQPELELQRPARRQ